MGGEGVVVGGGEFGNKLFQFWGSLEVDKCAAFDTYEVVMMGFERLSELVALLEADLNDIDDTEFCEELERAVDAGAFGEPTGAEDFLQRQRLVALVEDRKNIPARFSQAEIVVSEEHFETFHVASIRFVATYLQQEMWLRYSEGTNTKGTNPWITG